MTKPTAQTDDIFDITQLFDLDEIVASAEKKTTTVISPDFYNIEKALATPEEVDKSLRLQLSQQLHVDGIEDYIFKYGLRKLINETPGDHVYKRYDKYQVRIKKRLYESMILHTEHIFLSKRLSAHAKRLLIARRYWNRLSSEGKRQHCCNILIHKKTQEPTFIDLSFFYAKTPTQSQDGVDWEYEEDEDYNRYGRASFHECCFAGQHHALPGDIDKQLTIEEVVMACTDHIAQRDPNLSMSDKDAAVDMRDFILKRIENKITKRGKRLDALVEGITVTTLLHRLKDKPGQGYPKPNPEKPVRLSVADFPLFIMDNILSGLFSTRQRKALLAKPETEQRAFFKYSVQRIPLHRAIEEHNYNSVKKRGFLLPFIMDSNRLIATIRMKIREEITLNDADFSKLNTVGLSALKRFRGMSQLDRDMFWQLEQKRFHLLLDLFRSEHQYQHEGAIPEEKMERLRNSRFFADLYLLASDAGIRVAKLRKLVKMVYQQYLPDPHDRTQNMVRYSNVSHDILTSYEPHLISLLTGWHKAPRFSPIMNRIVDLLISQLGGAQGEPAKAFASWRKLPTLIGREMTLLDGNPKNMDEVFNLIKVDPVFIKKANPILRTLPSSVVPHEQLHQYVSNSIGNEAFYYYLQKVKENRARNIEKLTPVIPALTEAQHYMIRGLHLEILPYDDLLGALGVATQGVCIRFNDNYHWQHQSPAVANLIIRDEQQVWLWGVLIRAQDSKKATYLLNNLQGAFPSRHAKYKDEIRSAIRHALSELGEVYSMDFNFNAIKLLTDKEKTTPSRGDVIVPRMRLDVSGGEAPPDDFTHPNAEHFMSVDLSKMKKITAEKQLS